MSKTSPTDQMSAEDRLRSTLENVLWWCRQDAWNEDGFPTQTMFDARVNYLEEVLSGKSKVTTCK